MAMKDAFDLTGRVALVTGASSYGIGSVSAKLMAQHGAKVFLTARREEKLKEVAAEIEAEGGVAGYFACDVSNEDECKAAVEACVEQFGQLDIMVLSAGISGKSPSGGPEAWFDSENYATIKGINLDGVFFMIKHGWQECAKGGHGSIIPVSSLAAWRAEGSPSYTATKGAIRSMTHSLGKYFGPAGVRVNSLYPGFVDTDMTHGAAESEMFAQMKMPKIPLGRFGTPEDMAGGILFLASDASSWMTGQHLVIDGGECC